VIVTVDLNLLLVVLFVVSIGMFALGYLQGDMDADGRWRSR
jgi:hypothetical protein